MEPKKYFYKGYGLNICSEIPFPELPENEPSNDIVIKISKINLPSKNDIIIKGNHFLVTEDSIFLFWEGIGKFKIRNGNEIIVNPKADLDINIFNQYILGSAMAVLLNQRGYLILHGSAVNINDKAIAFLGETGMGKSTIANAFYQKGYPVIADDVLAVDIKKKKSLIIPSFPGLKLENQTSKTEKANIKFRSAYPKYFHCKNHGFSLEPKKLSQIYVLDNDPNLNIYSLSNQESLFNLLRNSYCISLFNEEEKIINLKQCAQLANSIPISQIKIPRDLNVFTELLNLIKNSVLGGNF